MSGPINIPYFPDPPPGYDRAYMAQVIRAFALFAQQSRNPGEGRNTFTVFTNLQDNDVGLEVGSVYKQGNQLFIVVQNVSAPSGVSAAPSVGTVTVVTS